MKKHSLVDPVQSALLNEALSTIGIEHSEGLTLLRRGTNLVLLDEPHGLVYRVQDASIFRPEWMKNNVRLIGELRSHMPTALSGPAGIAHNDNNVVTVWRQQEPVGYGADGFTALGEALAKFHQAGNMLTESQLLEESRVDLSVFSVSLEARFKRRLEKIDWALEPWAYDMLVRKSDEAVRGYSSEVVGALGEKQIVHVDAHVGNVVRNKSDDAAEMIDLDGICLSAQIMDFLPAYIRSKRFVDTNAEWESFCSAYSRFRPGYMMDESHLERLTVVKEAMMNTWLADHAVRFDHSLLSELYHRLRTWENVDNNETDDTLWTPC